MVDGQEDAEAVTDSSLSPAERTAAEKFLEQQRIATAAQEAKAKIAIEDALIARHRVTTGRNFHDREKNLADALQWQADQESAQRAKVEEVIRQQQKFAEQKAKQTATKPSPEIAPQTVTQRVVSFAKNLVGRK